MEIRLLGGLRSGDVCQIDGGHGVFEVALTNHNGEPITKRLVGSFITPPIVSYLRTPISDGEGRPLYVVRELIEVIESRLSAAPADDGFARFAEQATPEIRRHLNEHFGADAVIHASVSLNRRETQYFSRDNKIAESILYFVNCWALLSDGQSLDAEVLVPHGDEIWTTEIDKIARSLINDLNNTFPPARKAREAYINRIHPLLESVITEIQVKNYGDKETQSILLRLAVEIISMLSFPALELEIMIDKDPKKNRKVPKDRSIVTCQVIAKERLNRPHIFTKTFAVRTNDNFFIFLASRSFAEEINREYRFGF